MLALPPEASAPSHCLFLLAHRRVIITKWKGLHSPLPPPAHFWVGFVENAVLLLTGASSMSDRGPITVSEVSPCSILLGPSSGRGFSCWQREASAAHVTCLARLQIAHCSLSFLVCHGRVPLREEGRDLEPRKASRRADPGFCPGSGKRGSGADGLCGSGPAGGVEAQRLVHDDCHSSHFLCRCGLVTASGDLCACAVLPSGCVWNGSSLGIFMFLGSASPFFSPSCLLSIAAPGASN